MKRTITKIELIEHIKEADTRCRRWNQDKFDKVITDGFAEMATLIQPLIAVHFEELIPYYNVGEMSFDINLNGSVTYVYDMLLGVKNYAPESILDHKVLQVRDKNRIWKDGVKDDVIHVNLNDETYGRIFDYVEVKYSYVPVGADFDELLLPNQVYTVLEACIESALYTEVHDDDRAMKMLARAERISLGIADVYPNDFEEPGKPSLFPSGV